MRKMFLWTFWDSISTTWLPLTVESWRVIELYIPDQNYLIGLDKPELEHL